MTSDLFRQYRAGVFGADLDGLVVRLFRELDRHRTELAALAKAAGDALDGGNPDVLVDAIDRALTWKDET